MITYAVVPARGGSKGVPRKNLATVGGSTLLARAVRLAGSLPEISEVFVSTEDDEIAAEALATGAVVVPRPPELSTQTGSAPDLVGD